MKPFLAKLTQFFEKLASKPRVGGLQITDSALLYVVLEQGTPRQTFSVRLPPGVIQEGKVRNEEELLKAFVSLHNFISPENPKERVRVIVSLPSAVTYTQNFTVPNVGEKRLKESASLNLQMISPIPVENAYVSWQMLDETEDVYGLLGAFAEKDVVDVFSSVLERANFYPLVFEFPSLSLSWVIYSAIGARPESFLVLSVSSDGLDIFLLKNGSIYFDYFRSWRSIQGESRQISKDAFNQVVIEEVQKVVNFTSSRFGETLRYVFLVAPGLEKEVEQLVEGQFGIEASPLAVRFGKLTPTWYTVLGSAIRGSWDRSKDRFVSLGTERVQEAFYREQIVSFIRLWRNILAVVLGGFIILFGGASLILKIQPAALEERLEAFNVTAQERELSTLRQESEEFNRLVTAIGGTKESGAALFSFLERLRGIAASHRVILDRVDLTSVYGGVSVTMRAPTYETVIQFKNALAADPQFRDVNLPLSKIVTSEENFVVFDVTFTFAPKSE